MARVVVEIKLVQVSFVPTVYKVSETGEVVTPKRTVIGQLAYDCEFLPGELRSRLEEIIQQEYAKSVSARREQ